MRDGLTYKKLEEVCEILDSRRKPITKSQRTSGQIPYYGATGCLDFVKDYIFDEKLVLLGEDGAKWGAGESSAYIIDGKTWVNNHAHVLRPKRDVIVDEYLVNYLNYSNLLSYITGVTVPKLNQERMRSIPVPSPSLTEQQRIVDILDAEFAKIDALKANAEKNLQNAQDLFQAALRKEINSDITQPLIDLCESIIDCPHSTPIKSSTKTDYPCIRTSELGMGNIIWSSMQYVSKDEYQKRIGRLTPRYEDIVYGREGTIGNAIMIPKEYHFCLGQRTTLFRPNKSIVNPQYLLYCVLSPFVYKQAMEKNTGCGVAHVNVADIKQFKIPMGRTIIEQQSIVSKLDEISNNCNTLQDNYTQTLTLCDDLKQALLRKAFNGEL